MTYIESNYDTEYLEKVYISGDGSNWIKIGSEWTVKIIYVLDEFHMKKAVNEIVGRIKNSYRNKKGLHGCSAEGHISHIYRQDEFETNRME